MRVVLIGFMCSGKTRVGRELAAITGLRHVDLDRVIEQHLGPLLPWIQANGEAAFRQEERRTLNTLIEQEDIVLSTGGGTPCAADNMDVLLKAGVVIYLDVPIDVLVDRCARKGGDRPLLFGLSGAQLRDRVHELMAARLPVYDRAHVHMAATVAPEVIASRIARTLQGEEAD
jgi:shikimate kinase